MHLDTAMGQCGTRGCLVYEQKPLLRLIELIGAGFMHA